jgi:hypothetical protein
MSPRVELLPSLVLSPSVSKLGVIVTERVPSSVALSPRLASSPEHAIVVTKCAPSGVALSPERDVIIIVTAINNRVTTKQCFVGVGSGSRGDSKWEQVPLGRW